MLPLSIPKVYLVRIFAGHGSEGSFFTSPQKLTLTVPGIEQVLKNFHSAVKVHFWNWFKLQRR